MKKVSVNSPEYRDIVSKLLGKEVKFETLPIIKSSSQKESNRKAFTGIKDVDLLILKELSDEDLFFVCQVDKYIKSLCDNENFWLDKLLKKFPDYKLLKMKDTNTNNNKYKNIYKELYQLEKLKEELTF